MNGVGLTITARDAILAIRETVQDHGDEHTVIGKPAPLDQVKWLGGLLGFAFPQRYLDLISVHDGVTVREAHLLAFFDAFRSFVVHREAWHSLPYWPIAQDGCGNYWVLPLKEQQNGDCPVYFLDHETETGLAAPDHVAANSISAFVIEYMQSQWARSSA